MKRDLLLTFDYELFLGARSGTVKDCMLLPTGLVMELFETHQVKGIFFVDTTHLTRLREIAPGHEKAKEDYETIQSQLRQLISKGHYVFPHIHPHWLDAVYLPEQNEWSLKDTRKYRFHNLNASARAQVFDSSMEVLKTIIDPVRPDYVIDSYRAGGWSIQPFSDFQPFFEAHGIRYDFSVMSGYAQKTDGQYFDFTDIPDKPIYRFRDEVTREDPSGDYTELAISNIYFSGFQQLLHKVCLKFLNRFFGNLSFGQGSGVVPKALPENSGLNSLEHQGYDRVSMELLTIDKLAAYRAFLKDHTYMHFISHPKMLSPHHLKVMDKFLRHARSVYAIETDFRKMV